MPRKPKQEPAPKGIRTERRADGRTRYRIEWRQGGTREGERRSRSFGELEASKDFQTALHANGMWDPYEDPAWAAWLGVLPVSHVGGERPASMPTFGEVVEDYLAARVNALGRTVAEVRRDVETHVLPAVVTLPEGRSVGPLGALPIDALTADVIQAWVRLMQAKRHGRGEKSKPYSAKTIINIHGSCISPVLKFAVVKRGYLGANPSDGVELPRRRGRSVTSAHLVDIADMPAWIECAYDVDTDTGDITQTLLGTGLRWGEVTALRACDFSARRDEQGHIAGGLIRLAQVVREDAERRPYLASLEAEDAKSLTSIRSLSVGRNVASVLERRAADHWEDQQGLLFGAPGGRGGVIWRNPNFHSWRWAKVLERAAERGLKGDPSPHKLRHSHATALIDEHGLDAVSKRLGHSSVGITSSTYSHLTTRRDTRMADAIDSLLEGPEQ